MDKLPINSSSSDFKGKVILLTGASSGIGADAAVYLASLGASLSLTGRNVANLQTTLEEIKKVSNDVPLIVAGDLSKVEDVDNIFNETIKKYGRLDVLINNAGIMKLGPIEDTTLELYDEVMNTNVRCVVQLTKLALPYLIKSKGNIINISSIVGLRPSPGASAYSMSKSALDQFTKCIALEVGPKGVRVNSINPGLILTDLQRRSGVVDESHLDTYLDAVAKLHPLRKAGVPREISTVIAFLASDNASNITGVNLPVDGGMCIAAPS